VSPGPAFRAAYAGALRGYLRDPGEATLRTAYELGRDAVAGGLDVLELADAHHEVLAAALGELPTGADAERCARAAGAFLLESLSAFAMVSRGFREARDAAALERRHAHVLRRLSGFLADASLPVSLRETMILVAEHARELTGAASCTITVTGSTVCAGAPEGDAEWEERRGHLVAVADAPPGQPAPAGRLTAPLCGLDGRAIGSITVLDERADRFGDVEEAILTHLAHMTSAAVERALLYRRS
jgi:GAF domain-containing protein